MSNYSPGPSHAPRRERGLLRPEIGRKVGGPRQRTASAPASFAGDMARRKGGTAAAAASPAVVGAISTMALVYYSTVFIFLDHWLGLGTTAGAAHAVAVSLAVAACFLSFVCAAAADPGAVPASFAPDAEAAQGQVGELSDLSHCLLLALLVASVFLLV
jgi:hypothetical protein